MLDITSIAIWKFSSQLQADKQAIEKNYMKSIKKTWNEQNKNIYGISVNVNIQNRAMKSFIFLEKIVIKSASQVMILKTLL